MISKKIIYFPLVCLIILFTSSVSKAEQNSSKIKSGETLPVSAQEQGDGFTLQGLLNSQNISDKDAQHVIDGVKVIAGVSICVVPSFRIVRLLTGMGLAASGLYNLHQNDFNFKNAADKSVAITKEMAEKALPKIRQSSNDFKAWLKEAWNKPVDKGQNKK